MPPAEPAVIIVVEDDIGIGSGLVRLLEAEGYRPLWCQTASEGRDRLAAGADLLLLDLTLPDGDGLDLCRQAHQAQPGLPIVMLTARSTETDVVLGLDAGAVDYLVKPFRLAELLARLRAHLRSATRPHPAEGDILEVGDVRVDVDGRRAFVAGEEVPLRPKEFDLLVLLLRHAGRAVTRSVAMTEVWDEHWYGSTKTLDVHIAALRQRLGETDVAASRITTLRGVGYRYELPTQQANLP